MYNTFSFCSRDHWNSESIPCLEVEVFDVSHNPELGGIIPEQIIVDWAEARPQKCWCYLPEMGQLFWPFGPLDPRSLAQGSGLFGNSEHNNCRIHFESLQ